MPKAAESSNLPSSNSAFGQKTLTLTHPDLPGNDTKQIKIFFGRTFANNPGGTTPNWYYYWKQTSAYIGAVGYDGSSPHGHCLWDAPNYSAYVGSQDHDSYTPGSPGDNAGNTLEGIDNFAWTCRHEWKHHINLSNWWGAGGHVPAQDGDGDGIKNDPYELNMTSADGGPFDITKYDTFPTDWLNNDHERQTVVTQSHWGEGSADTEDWANPGHQ
jgi:hypothetical protein